MSQLTLALLKPHIVNSPQNVVLRKKFLNCIKQNQIDILEQKVVHLNPDSAAEFYAQHQTKWFFNKAVRSLSQGPLEAYILRGNDIISRWRSIIGPSHINEARGKHPESLRAHLGVTDTRNAVHGSDSVENAKREIGLFWKGYDQWPKGM